MQKSNNRLRKSKRKKSLPFPAYPLIKSLHHKPFWFHNWILEKSSLQVTPSYLNLQIKVSHKKEAIVTDQNNLDSVLIWQKQKISSRSI